MCEGEGEDACPPEVEAERNREETQLCYKRPCPGSMTSIISLAVFMSTLRHQAHSIIV